FEHFGDTEVFIDGQGDPLDLQTLDGAAGGDRLTAFIQAILTVVSTLIRRNFGLQDVHAQTQASGCRIFRNQTANERQVSSREHSTGQFRLVSTILGTAIKRVGAINGVCTTATNEQSIVGGAPLGKEREQRQVDRKTFFFQNLRGAAVVFEATDDRARQRTGHADSRHNCLPRGFYFLRKKSR